MKTFLEYFKQLTPVSERLEQELLLRTSQLQIKKGEFLHRAGSVCTHTYWIKKGLLRTYYLKEGREVTDVFAAENEMITSAHSFMKNEPDQYYLQAVEDTKLFAISYQDLMFLFEHYHEMERFGRITMSISYIQLSEKLKSYQFTTAKDKYEHFCKVYKPILPRLPLGMVASYLGFSQETLSRIRGKS